MQKSCAICLHPMHKGHKCSEYVDSHEFAFRALRVCELIQMHPMYEEHVAYRKLQIAMQYYKGMLDPVCYKGIGEYESKVLFSPTKYVALHIATDKDHVPHCKAAAGQDEERSESGAAL